MNTEWKQWFSKNDQVKQQSGEYDFCHMIVFLCSPIYFSEMSWHDHHMSMLLTFNHLINLSEMYTSVCLYAGFINVGKPTKNKHLT